MKKLALKNLRSGKIQRQSGEMPIGPILIIALIVLPLVIALVLYGGQIADSFIEATGAVSDANDEGAAQADAPTAPGG